MTRLLLILPALLLSACGIKGDLATPPPVFGKDRAPAAGDGVVGDADDLIIDTEEQDDDEGPFYGPDIESDFGEDD